MRTAALELSRTLADRLFACPEDFSGDQAQAAMAWLLEHAEMARQAQTLFATHRTHWFLLPEAERQTASRRQLAALAARIGMRNGMDQNEAVRWVIDLSRMTRRDFTRACADVLKNGDRLFVWQWQELQQLGLEDGFASRRQIALWLEAEEPWLFDGRWVFPLHLVDKAVIERFIGAALNLTEPGDDDGSE